MGTSEGQLKEENPRGKESEFSLYEYVKEAQEHVKEGKCLRAPDEAFVSKNIYMMFVDVCAGYSVRLGYLQYFINLGKENVTPLVLRPCLAPRLRSKRNYRNEFL
jgi:hypothetical protein